MLCFGRPPFFLHSLHSRANPNFRSSRAFVFPSAFIGRQVRSFGVQTGLPRVKFKGRENWLREVCRQAGKHSHESQFEGRLWTHFQMDFMNTVQIMQVCLLDLLVKQRPLCTLKRFCSRAEVLGLCSDILSLASDGHEF